MTTIQINCFLEVAKYLSFTEASKRLFITQSSLSKQIAALERELGVTLFHRSNRCVTLTEAGVLMRAECEKILTSLQLATNHAQQLAQKSEWHLSIAVLDVINPTDFIIPAIHRLQELRPNVILELFFCGFRDIRERLQRKHIDMVFTKKFELDYMPPVRYCDAYPVTPSVAVHADSPLAQCPFLTIKDIAPQQFVVLDSDECSVHESSLATMCGKEGLSPRVIRYASSNTDRIFYVHEGYGVALCDQDIPIPSWANVRVIPMKSSLQSLFSDTNVILAWREDSGNPVAEDFAGIVQGLALERAAANQTARMYFQQG